jgi:hypothetical protein
VASNLKRGIAKLACSLAAVSAMFTLGACDEGGAHASGGPNSRAAYCEAGSNAALFLVDRTTQYDETDQRVMIESIGSVIDSLGTGDRFVLATIDAHYTGSERLANECKPGCPSQGALEAMTGGCSAMIAQADLRNFKAELAESIRPLATTNEEAKSSDIAGTIAQWTQSPPAGKPFNQVYIFSDMLENSQAIPWAKFKTMEPADAVETMKGLTRLPSVDGATVRIVGFGRLHDPGRPPLAADMDARIRTFWSDFFKAGGATSVTFEGAIRN